MKRPGTSSWRRGLLLVEAGLAAVAIAVGLVFLTRGLSSQLRAIRRLQEQSSLQAAARNLLVEQEGARVFGRRGSQETAGTVEGDAGTYAWAMTTAPCEALRNPLATEVTLALQPPTGQPGPSIGFRSIWPLDWIQQ